MWLETLSRSLLAACLLNTSSNVSTHRVGREAIAGHPRAETAPHNNRTRSAKQQSPHREVQQREWTEHEGDERDRANTCVIALVALNVPLISAVIVHSAVASTHP